MDLGKQKIRFPAVAGSFYPDDREELQKLVNRLLLENKQHGDAPKALIIPHAGYIFSGVVAASGYSLLNATMNNPTIFLIGASHRSLFHDAALDPHEAFQTPMGNVPLAKVTYEQLAKTQPLFALSSEPHRNEHTLEVQLPFLQAIYHDRFTIAPILLGSASTNELQQMATTLQPFFERPETLWVISTDLSHYPPMETAQETDQRVIEAICTGDPEMLKNTLKHEANRNLPGYQTGLCGFKAVLLLQYITNRLKTARYRLVKYQNSGHSPQGSHQEVVGYAAISVTI